MMHNPLADAISVIKNAEKIGKRECTVIHASNMLKDVLETMKASGYIESFEKADDGKGGQFKITLAGKINDCNIITPRHSVKKDGYELWEKRFLPAAGVGVLIVSTSQGIKAHKDVKDKLGGSLIAYVY